MSNDLDVPEAPHLYQLDSMNRDQLIASAPLMVDWSRANCAAKAAGGMEEWAKAQYQGGTAWAPSCDWYHGTWQLLRLLNMVAVPPWYEFYHPALRRVLLDRPRARVLISAAADYGMLATLHAAVIAAGATPAITVCDICPAPLLACQWYADRHAFSIERVCCDLLADPGIPAATFDLIVTDEFLTVLKPADKPLIIDTWKRLLKPDGVVVTTAMTGAATTSAMRHEYAARATDLLARKASLFGASGLATGELAGRFEQFASFHTRHMMAGEAEIRALFSDFRAEITSTLTPGECINPTTSFQVIAAKAARA